MAVAADNLDDFAPRRFSLLTAIRRNPTIAFGGVLLFLLVLVAVIGPSFVGDPFKIAPVNRLRPPSERWWFGTDQFGRDVFTRTVYGARVSLIVGLSSRRSRACSASRSAWPAAISAASTASSCASWTG